MRYDAGSASFGFFLIALSIIYAITYFFTIELDPKTWMTIIVICFFLAIGIIGLPALIPSIATIIYYLILTYTNWFPDIHIYSTISLALFCIIWFFGALIGAYLDFKILDGYLN